MSAAPTTAGYPVLRTAGRGDRTHLRSVAEQGMVALARLLVRVFFRQVQVDHGDRLRPGVPTVLVADHRNGLVDGLVLMAVLNRFPRFLGKSTLFTNPILWPFLKLAGVVPIYRPEDGEPTSRNRGSFAAANQLLGQGAMVAIFPEGISHDQSTLQPLHTGAARIALAAVDGGVADVETVAVSLLYDDKQRFRSRVLVRVGRPLPVDGGTSSRWPSHSGDNRSAVRHLTDDLARRLRHLEPVVGGSDDADVLTDIAEVVARADGTGFGPVALAEREQMREALLTAGDASRGNTDPDSQIEGLRRAGAAYRRARVGSGLTDAQIASALSPSPWRGSAHGGERLASAIATELLLLVPAVLGVLIHALPYLVVKAVSRIPSNEGIRATVKILGNLVLFSLVYLALGVVVGLHLGVPVAVLVVLGAPLCGYLTVVAAERLVSIADYLRVNQFARSRNADLVELADRRNAVRCAAAALGVPVAGSSGP